MSCIFSQKEWSWIELFYNFCVRFWVCSVGKPCQEVSIIELEWCNFKYKTKTQVQKKKKSELQSGSLNCCSIDQKSHIRKKKKNKIKLANVKSP